MCSVVVNSGCHLTGTAIALHQRPCLADVRYSCLHVETSPDGGNFFSLTLNAINL